MLGQPTLSPPVNSVPFPQMTPHCGVRTGPLLLTLSHFPAFSSFFGAEGKAGRADLGFCFSAVLLCYGICVGEGQAVPLRGRFRWEAAVSPVTQSSRWVTCPRQSRDLGSLYVSTPQTVSSAEWQSQNEYHQGSFWGQ